MPRGSLILLIQVDLYVVIAFALWNSVCCNVCPITIKNVGHSVLVKDVASRKME